jgi:hypothetical protein
MVLGLLLVALACLVLGMILASGPWLAGSLAASSLAGVLLLRQRHQIARRSAAARSSLAPGPTDRISAVTVSSAYSPADAEVWVVDGLPGYHVEVCSQISGDLREAVARAQAIEDGFVECAQCRPNNIGTPSEAASGEVWVIDGRPAYHLQGCATITDLDAEPILRAQATEDGFMPCSACAPDSSPA